MTQRGVSVWIGLSVLWKTHNEMKNLSDILPSLANVLEAAQRSVNTTFTTHTVKL